MPKSERSPIMPKAQPKSPDLLALAMRRARDDVAAGRVPKHPVERKDGLSKPQTGKPIKTRQFTEERSTKEPGMPR